MTTREFIEREFAQSGKPKAFSSVFKDRYGNIYSYGYHYPLLFQMGGHTFLNTAGYSVTTAKHIRWASQACHNYIEVKLPQDSRLEYWWNMPGGEQAGLKQIEELLIEQSTQLIMEMAKKKRQDTQVFRSMEHELITLSTGLEAIRA